MKKPISLFSFLILLNISFACAASKPDLGFSIQFPLKINTSSLTLYYDIAGRFGGVSDRLTSTSNAREYKIPTTYAGKKADRLKAFIYIPDYEIYLIDIPSLANHPNRELEINLKPLPSLPLTGKIFMSEKEPIKGFHLSIRYLAEWGYQFFGYYDGSAPEISCSSNIAPDGTFTVLVPDILRDPSLASFKEKGKLWLTIVDSKTGNMPYSLELADGRSADEIKVMDRYPTLLTLYANIKHPKIPKAEQGAAANP